MNKFKKIAIMGGGTGSYVVASGLSKENVHVSMLMTMADEGGSNKIIRDEFGLLPTSGIRQAIVALSKNKTVLRKLFTYRYHQGGNGLAGMTFGNLFMAAMADITGSQKKGIEETCKLLQVNGEILPVSYDNIRLVAEYSNGKVLVGEHEIDTHKQEKGAKITKFYTKPSASANPEAIRAILEADLIILGPGDFYTNTVANLVVEGVAEALKKSKGEILFVTNLMNSASETPGYKQSDFFADLQKYLQLGLIDYVLVNNNRHFPKAALEAYEQEAALPIIDDLDESVINSKVKIVRTDLLSEKIAGKVKGDVLARSIIRHDSLKLASAIMNLE